MTSGLIEATALRLRHAYGGQTLSPLRDVLEPTDIETAYAVQLANTRHWMAEGRRIVGRKIGLTSEAVQKQLGVDQPDFGALFDDMIIPDGANLSPSRVLQAKAEAEIALVLAHDLNNADATPDDVAAATAHAVAAIEIVDSRISDWKITFADTVADNASSAFFVLGSDPKPLDGLDLVGCRMTLEFDGEIVSEGVGAACLGHPLNAAAWLARTLASRGEPLRAGDILMTGALGPMAIMRPGTEVRATIEGLGSVSFTFSQSPS